MIDKTRFFGDTFDDQLLDHLIETGFSSKVQAHRDRVELDVGNEELDNEKTDIDNLKHMLDAYLVSDVMFDSIQFGVIPNDIFYKELELDYESTETFWFDYDFFPAPNNLSFNPYHIPIDSLPFTYDEFRFFRPKKYYIFLFLVLLWSNNIWFILLLCLYFFFGHNEAIFFDIHAYEEVLDDSREMAGLNTFYDAANPNLDPQPIWHEIHDMIYLDQKKLVFRKNKYLLQNDFFIDFYPPDEVDEFFYDLDLNYFYYHADNLVLDRGLCQLDLAFMLAHGILKNNYIDKNHKIYKNLNRKNKIFLNNYCNKLFFFSKNKVNLLNRQQKNYVITFLEEQKNLTKFFFLKDYKNDLLYDVLFYPDTFEMYYFDQQIALSYNTKSLELSKINLCYL